MCITSWDLCANCSRQISQWNRFLLLCMLMWYSRLEWSENEHWHVLQENNFSPKEDFCSSLRFAHPESSVPAFSSSVAVSGITLSLFSVMVLFAIIVVLFTMVLLLTNVFCHYSSSHFYTIVSRYFFISFHCFFRGILRHLYAVNFSPICRQRIRLFYNNIITSNNCMIFIRWFLLFQMLSLFHLTSKNFVLPLQATDCWIRVFLYFEDVLSCLSTETTEKNKKKKTNNFDTENEDLGGSLILQHVSLFFGGGYLTSNFVWSTWWGSNSLLSSNGQPE